LSFRKEIANRKKRLAKWLRANGFDAAIFLKEEIEFINGNFIYFGGAETSSEYSAIVIDSSENSYAIAHEYSYERVASSAIYDEVFEIRQSIDELISTLKRIIQERLSRQKQIAFDFGTTKASTLRLVEQTGVKVADDSLTSFVYSERATKSEFELEEMNAAIGIAKNALEKTLDSLKEGQSISEITKLMNQNLIGEGALIPSFETDVRLRRDLAEEEVPKLRRGDLVLFDFGARLPSMYPSDVGRTIPFGNPSKATKDFLSNVISIKKEGIKLIKAGRTGNEVRADIDHLIEEHGNVSTHRPGHQIGINVHEPYEPHLAYGKENNLKLKSGNVLTWEPGIGFKETRGSKNRFGMAHVEDMVRVSDDSRFLGNFDLQFW
jgi:Xaa-Pro aminopeptidase